MTQEIPVAKKIPFEITQHNHTRVDNYAWLRDQNWQKFIAGDLDFSDPDVLMYLRSEASYTKSVMDQSLPLRKELYDEMLSRVKEDDAGYPMKYKNFYYYSKTVKGLNYPIYCRKKDSISSEEEIYFDVNAEAKGLPLYILGSEEVCQENRYLGYTFNLTGSMERTLKVRDLNGVNLFDWEIPETTGSFEWDRDGLHIFYCLRNPENGRGDKVYRFNIFDGPKSAKLIFEKPDSLEHMFMGISKCESEDYLFIENSNTNSNETYLINLKSEDLRVELISEAEKTIHYSFEHFENSFYILTNVESATNFKVMKCSIDKFERENWQDFIPEIDNNLIEGISVYKNHLILEVQNNEMALEEIIIHNLYNQEVDKIVMNQEAYSLSFTGAYEFDSDEVRFYLESPVMPVQTIDYNLITKNQVVRKIKDVPNYNPENYEVKRLFAEGHDGVEIPLTLVHKKYFKIDGSAPAFVYAYGSYGYSMPPFFSSHYMSLVDRGFTFAIAHIRGGKDKGEMWYQDGKMMKKKNTFLDYISCCEYLIDKGYSSKGKIVANGGSAGGLLMGAVANMAPTLFNSVIADVPFVDMINTISDETLPLTPPEWEEWGDPIKNREEFEYMLSYSPYDNIKKMDYPHMLYNSGISDEQVTYWEPAKMVAKLRELKTDDNTLLLNIKMHAGHAGASKRYEYIEDEAFNFAFILERLDS